MTTATTSVCFFSFLYLISIQYCCGWIHHLKLINDERRHIAITTSFGFLQGGTLDVNMTWFSYYSEDQNDSNSFAFTLDKSRSSSVLTTMANSPQCKWMDSGKSVQSISFHFDLPKQRILISRHGQEVQNLTITEADRTQYLYRHGLAHGEPYASKTEVKQSSEVKASTPEGKSKADVTTQKSKPQTRKRRAAVSTTEEKNAKKDKNTVKDGEKKQTGSDKEKETTTPGLLAAGAVQNLHESVALTRERHGSGYVYRTHFLVHIKTVAEEGLYSFFFHNCLQHHLSPINLSLDIVQDNNGNYLSADEMPIPGLYFILSVVFFMLTISWFSVLRKADEGVYKLHYMMLVVVFFKSLSCLFHGVNLFMIQHTGIHVDAWAILWYIVYLMRGALMFVTILLIGAGWVFIKHVFTDREKKLFLIVIPLQILDNVAWVIMEESEEGNSNYDTWHKIFIGFDLICCFTILFPVIWSIRHLQEASKTDGKAAMNLVKLKLFRHYYFMVVCYIYFTRIIKYFLEITLPFHYGWLESVFTETFLLIFYILIGYKFRPMSDNPYLQVPLDSDDEDIEMDEVLTKTGCTEGVVRVNQGRSEEEGTSVTVIKQRESSHEYD